MNLYLASCIDLGSRKLAERALVGHMRTGCFTSQDTANDIVWAVRAGN